MFSTQWVSVTRTSLLFLVLILWFVSFVNLSACIFQLFTSIFFNWPFLYGFWLFLLNFYFMLREKPTKIDLDSKVRGQKIISSSTTLTSSEFFAYRHQSPYIRDSIILWIYLCVCVIIFLIFLLERSYRMTSQSFLSCHLIRRFWLILSSVP